MVQLLWETLGSFIKLKHRPDYNFGYLLKRNKNIGPQRLVKEAQSSFNNSQILETVQVSVNEGMVKTTRGLK